VAIFDWIKRGEITQQAIYDWIKRGQIPKQGDYNAVADYAAFFTLFFSGQEEASKEGNWLETIT
jgi:hypothetical protein